MPMNDLTVKTFEDVAADVGVYHVDAYYFIERSLGPISERFHPDAVGEDRHVTGQQLCEGLRELAVEQWGLLAGTVLWVWGIHATIDFGNIVYALIDAGLFSKTDEDSVEDFRDVYDFKKAFAAPPRGSRS